MRYVQKPPAATMHTINYKITNESENAATFEMVSRSTTGRTAWEELEAWYHNDVEFANGLPNRSSIQKQNNIIGKWESILETIEQKVKPRW